MEKIKLEDKISKYDLIVEIHPFIPHHRIFQEVFFYVLLQPETFVPQILFSVLLILWAQQAHEHQSLKFKGLKKGRSQNFKSKFYEQF